MWNVLTWLWALHPVLAATAIAYILRGRKEPTAMLAWIFGVLLLPFVGVLLYLVFGADRVGRRATRKRERFERRVSPLRRRGEREGAQAAQAFSPGLPEDLGMIEGLARRLAEFPAVGGNEVTLYQEANATYAALEEALREARHFIHLEYYIWQPDETGTLFRDLVIERQKAGVKCRLLLDSVGCWRLGRRFLQPLRDAGVEVGFFLPLLRFGRQWTPHLRNHRKIGVVDGRIGFVGSQNVGDEYRGRLRKYSPWYDTHMRIRGPAVRFLEQTFAEDWLFATRETLPQTGLPARAGESIVQILPTGPDQDLAVLGRVVFTAVTGARSAVRIATPYFVPDAALRMALTQASLRGVRVQLVLPTRSDSPLALWAGRSFYDELLDAGVEIFEFDAGVLHSKILTVDERFGMVGSANMDVRSFRLNFEITALVYDAGPAKRLDHDIEAFLARSRRIRRRETARPGLPRELAEGVARLFAPLL